MGINVNQFNSGILEISTKNIKFYMNIPCCIIYNIKKKVEPTSLKIGIWLYKL